METHPLRHSENHHFVNVFKNRLPSLFYKDTCSDFIFKYITIHLGIMA